MGKQAILKRRFQYSSLYLNNYKNKCLNYLRHQQIHEEYSDKIKDYYEWELNTRIATLQACEPYELFISEIQELVQQTLTDMPEKPVLSSC